MTSRARVIVVVLRAPAASRSSCASDRVRTPRCRVHAPWEAEGTGACGPTARGCRATRDPLAAASPRKKHSALSGAGHPRSRNYSDGHNAWVAGEPTPFMPGQSVTRLVLKPR